MRAIMPLHGRANIIPRPDIAAGLHELIGMGGEITSEVFGRVHVGDQVTYVTPCPRDSFAFGQVGAMGQPSMEGSGAQHPGVAKGDIVGFDLYQVGHEIDAAPYYPEAKVFYTLPWKEIACRFVDGLPIPAGPWCMLEPDELMTRRLIFASSGTMLHMPGVGASVRTNSNQRTKVRLAAGKVQALGCLAVDDCTEPGIVGQWALYNPIDAVTIDLGKAGKMAFVKFQDLEQLVGDAE